MREVRAGLPRYSVSSAHRAIVTGRPMPIGRAALYNFLYILLLFHDWIDFSHRNQKKRVEVGFFQSSRMLQRNGTFAIFDAPLPVGTATIRKRCLTYVVTALWSVEAPVKVCSRVFRELLPSPSSVLALASPYVILRTGSTTQQRVDPIVIIMYNVILAPILVPRRSMIITVWSAEFCSMALASATPVSSPTLV